ncbi:hypothetical protein ASG68_22805 [Rhizobium sp. Leaf453]|nr:hypothetical protein ASG42_24555 [Rhizobium sp. Leaf391]KQU08420.1 hypothetical protein ASG68_22805 [Rhizobium sp. Leaf453]
MVSLMAVSLAKDLDKFVLRLPSGLRDRIKVVAEENNRSMNAEIVATLEVKYPEVAFDVGAFMTDWMIPILRATSSAGRRATVGAANAYLDKNNPGMFVELLEDDDRRPQVVLNSNGARIMVSEPPAPQQPAKENEETPEE